MIKLKRRKKSQNFSFSFTEKKHLLKNLERSIISMTNIGKILAILILIRFEKFTHRAYRIRD